MNDPRQRSSSKRTRRGRSPSPRPGCINAASSATPAPAPQQQPSRPHTGSSSYIMNSAGGADSIRRRTPTPPTTIGRTSPMTTSARRMEDGGIGVQTSTTGGTVHVVLGGLGGTTPGSFVPPHLRPAGAVGPTGSSGGRRGLVRRTHSPKTVVSDRYLHVSYYLFICAHACLAGLLFFAIGGWRICSRGVVLSFDIYMYCSRRTTLELKMPRYRYTLCA